MSDLSFAQLEVILTMKCWQFHRYESSMNINKIWETKRNDLLAYLEQLRVNIILEFRKKGYFGKLS